MAMLTCMYMCTCVQCIHSVSVCMYKYMSVYVQIYECVCTNTWYYTCNSVYVQIRGNITVCTCNYMQYSTGH